MYTQFTEQSHKIHNDKLQLLQNCSLSALPLPIYNLARDGNVTAN